MKTKDLCPILLLLLLTSCTNTTENKPETNVPIVVNTPPSINKRTGWLAGAWKMTIPTGAIYEVWNNQDDSTMQSKSFAVNGKDTIPQETVSLQYRAGKLLYIVTVVNQNNGTPVIFTASAADTADTISFSNLEHDFPQHITYQRIKNDSLLVTISGSIKGKIRKEDFPMVRVK